MAGVKWVMRHWPLGLLVLAVVVAGAVWLFRILPTAFVPQEDQGYIFVAYFLPDAASLDPHRRGGQPGGDDHAQATRRWRTCRRSTATA